MPALAPVVTQTVATDLTPCPAGTVVATLATDPGETDPGPFNYTVTTGVTTFSVAGTDLTAMTDLSGANDVGVTVTGSDTVASPETTATITVGVYVPPEPGEGENPYDETGGGYEGNPNVPPPLDPGAPPDADWDKYLVQAVNNILPWARNTVDFVVSKPDWGSPNAITTWDDALLGACPNAAIETEARRLATADQGVP